jgi:hypothetical protein
VSLLGSCQVIDLHLCRSDYFLTPAVTALENRQDGVVGLSRITALRKRFVPVRVERFADDFVTLDPVLPEQLLKLLQRHLDAFMKLHGIARGTGSQGPFEVVNDWQQLSDERLLLRNRAGFGFLAGTTLKVFKVGGQTQMLFPLFGKILEERF